MILNDMLRISNVHTMEWNADNTDDMMSSNNYKHSGITEKIIKGFFVVYNTLGYGFLEKVYENAMFIELTAMNLSVQRQRQIKVYYEGKEVGEYFADLLVEDCVIVELKASESLCEEHEFQLINYLKATEIEVGLLLNFGKKPEVKRKVFSNPNGTQITRIDMINAENEIINNHKHQRSKNISDSYKHSKW